VNRGSWQERQIYDRDPFSLPQDDRRGKVEFWLPLVFYLFAWLNFFMVIPRSWSNIEHQRSPQQQALDAEPSGTDNRLKAGSILAVFAYAVICFSLHHSLKHYKPRNAGLMGRINGFCRDCPTKIFLSLLVLAVRLGYGIASAWEWNMSILKYNVNPAWPFGLGYGTTIVIIIIFEVAGWVEENEDKKLIEQRRQRGRSTDAELGITRKPNWWRKLHSDAYLSDEQRLRNLTREVGGGRPTTNRISANVELRTMSGNEAAANANTTTSIDANQRSNLRDRSRSRPRDDPFRDPSPAESTSTGTARLVPTRTESDAASAVSGMTGRTLTNENAKPQQIRSMLDV
jgi:hypothetical protein